MKIPKLLPQYMALIFMAALISWTVPRTAGNSDTVSVIHTVTTSTPSMRVVLKILRDNGIVANYEGGAGRGEKDTRVLLPTGAVPISTFIKAVTEGFGCKSEMESGRLTFYDSIARERGRESVLNAVIDDLKVDNARADDVVNRIGQKLNVKLVCTSLSNFSAIPGKPVSLALHQITVRKALNQIVNAAGLLGWESRPCWVAGQTMMTTIEFDNGMVHGGR